MPERAPAVNWAPLDVLSAATDTEPAGCEAIILATPVRTIARTFAADGVRAAVGVGRLLGVAGAVRG